MPSSMASVSTSLPSWAETISAKRFLHAWSTPSIELDSMMHSAMNASCATSSLSIPGSGSLPTLTCIFAEMLLAVSLRNLSSARSVSPLAALARLSSCLEDISRYLAESFRFSSRMWYGSRAWLARVATTTPARMYSTRSATTGSDGSTMAAARRAIRVTNVIIRSYLFGSTTV